MTYEQKQRLYILLHVLWSKAVGTKDYCKAEWMELDNLLGLYKKEQDEARN